MVTVERAYGATYLKLDGITRAIWLPRSLSPDRTTGVRLDRESRIVVLMLRGWGVVVAPFRPR
jgi:hypothetical protein